MVIREVKNQRQECVAQNKMINKSQRTRTIRRKKNKNFVIMNTRTK